MYVYIALIATYMQTCRQLNKDSAFLCVLATCLKMHKLQFTFCPLTKHSSYWVDLCSDCIIIVKLMQSVYVSIYSIQYIVNCN